jgi:hypothetical protein
MPKLKGGAKYELPSMQFAGAVIQGSHPSDVLHIDAQTIQFYVAGATLQEYVGLTKYHQGVRRRELASIVVAMVVVAAIALLVNHYAFSQKFTAPTTTSTTIPAISQAYRACVADGATISTAMAAFEAQNPGVTVTESDLVGNTLGGPYLQSWANNPTFYSFSLLNGILYVRYANSNDAVVKFAGSSSCLAIGL